jgi:hypothetical protein
LVGNAFPLFGFPQESPGVIRGEDVNKRHLR